MDEKKDSWKRVYAEIVGGGHARGDRVTPYIVHWLVNYRRSYLGQERYPNGSHVPVVGDNGRRDLLLQNKPNGAHPQLTPAAGDCLSDRDPGFWPHGHNGLRTLQPPDVPQVCADTSERQAPLIEQDDAAASERDLYVVVTFDLNAMD